MKAREPARETASSDSQHTITYSSALAESSPRTHVASVNATLVFHVSPLTSIERFRVSSRSSHFASCFPFCFFWCLSSSASQDVETMDDPKTH